MLVLDGFNAPDVVMLGFGTRSCSPPSKSVGRRLAKPIIRITIEKAARRARQ